VSPLPPLQIHATCVARDGLGVLLRGASGAGKSDLGFRLIDRGFALVADDRVELCRDGERLLARAPASLAGLIELRGIGIVAMDAPVAPAALGLVVDLVAPAAVERLPEPACATYLGIAVPLLALDPFAASAPAKIAFALGAPAALGAAAAARKPAA